MFIVVSYDIKDDKRRTRVYKTLKNYGQHVQFSVFECDLDKADYLRLRRKLERIIKAGEDSIRFYFLCDRDVKRVERIGGVEPWSEGAIFA
jgi:CRISPR-associated protein Cas2